MKMGNCFPKYSPIILMPIHNHYYAIFKWEHLNHEEVK